MSQQPKPRRAGLRDDERDPAAPNEPAGSAGGGANMSGVPAGGAAGGGLAGSNQGAGTPDSAELEDALGVGIYDSSGDTDEGGPPYAGPSGGAVGGTPAEKRSKGGRKQRD